MTDEIKMCRIDGLCSIQAPERIVDRWIPLDPQPSCKNCKNWIDHGVKFNICNGVKNEFFIEGWRVPLITSEDFFCKYWEMKK